MYVGPVCIYLYWGALVAGYVGHVTRSFPFGRPAYGSSALAAAELRHLTSPQNLRFQPTSDGLQPTSDGLQPTSDGLQPTSDGLQPTSDGLQPTSDGLQPNSNASPITSVIHHG